MPELPDITVYVECLRERLIGRPLVKIRLKSPFLLRSVSPPLAEATGRKVIGVERLGKRVVLALEGERFLVIHLMISGRLRWRPPGAPVTGKIALAVFDFPEGTLLLTEASSKKRASLFFVAGRDGLAALDPGGLEVLTATPAAFHAALHRENHTLKRALTDPRLFSGIGNAYSDEILHRARMSPVKLTRRLSEAESARMLEAAKAALSEWTDRLRRETAGKFPEKVTAFHKEMAVHGRYRLPCPVCAAPVQRIVHAENESNYCAGCQTGGKILADRALSRLLHKDWPRTLDEFEARFGGKPGHKA